MEPDSINNAYWSQWQLLDSFLPTGGFAHSYGLEAAIQSCFVVSPEDLQTYTLSVLDNTGSLLLPFVCATTKSPDFKSWLQLDRLLEVTLTNEVSRKASSSQGSALIRVGALIFHEIPALKKIRETALASGAAFFHHATVFGLICGLLGFGNEFSQRAYMHLTMRDVLSAATRLNLIGPLGAAVLQHRMSSNAELILLRWKDHLVKDACQSTPLLDTIQGCHGNGSRDHCGAKFCRNPRKVAVLSQRKVSDLISSTKKKKLAEIHSRSVPELGRDLSAACDFLEDENDGICMGTQVSVDHMSDDERISHEIQDTIFYPSFFHSKHSCASVSKEAGDADLTNVKEGRVDFVSVFTMNEQKDQNDLNTTALKTSYPNSYDKTEYKIFAEDKMEFEPMDTDKESIELSINLSNHTMLSKKIGHVFHTESHSGCEDEFSSIGDLSPEVSAIYLAMQHSKLECVDEKSQDSISEEVCAEPEEDEFDDFDPYLFIKDLPDLSMVVPKFRSLLLPRRTRSCPLTTLVLDLDETLVHSTLEPCKDADFAFPVKFNLKEHTIYVRCRPFLKNFLERVATLFETIIFTASQSIYAEQLLNLLDPKRKLFRHRVFRESCVYVEGNYLKDLSILGRDLAQVIIVDNSPQAFGFQLDNGIPIESWYEDRSDRELLSLLPFLESLAGAADVRPLIAQRFKLRQKVAAATIPLDFRR